MRGPLEPTLGIAIFAGILSVALLMAVLALLALVGVLVWRSRRGRPSPRQSSAQDDESSYPDPVTPPPVYRTSSPPMSVSRPPEPRVTPQPARSATPMPARRATAVTPPPAPPPLPPPMPPPASLDGRPPPLGGGLLGFFDDESSVPGEAARTELFQRGKLAADWDDEAEEGEATEIFSAHGAAGDLAEFAFDDAEDATGRFNPNLSRR